MKNVIYYSALIILWAIIHVLFGTAMLAFGAIEGPFPSPLIALAIAALIPEYWFITIGLTMFTRDLMAWIILDDKKKHSKVVPTILVAIGSIMVIASTLISVFQNMDDNKATQTQIAQKIEVPENRSQSYKEEPITHDGTISDYDLLLTRTISDFKSALHDEFEKIKEKTPIVIDEITTLRGIKSSGSTYTFIYRLEVDKNNFTENEWKEIIEGFEEDKKIEFYYETIGMCAMEEVEPNDFFKAANIKLQYTFADINNQHIGTCGFEYKELAKE